jgi:hypothetical protein
MVVQVERDVCAVVGDATKSQFRVNSRDLTEGKENAPGLEVGGWWLEGWGFGAWWAAWRGVEEA